MTPTIQTLTQYHQVLEDFIRVNQRLTDLQKEKSALLLEIQNQTPRQITHTPVDLDSVLPPLSEITPISKPKTSQDFLSWLKQNYPPPGTFSYRQIKVFFRGKNHNTIRRALTNLTATGDIQPVVPGGIRFYTLTQG